MSFFDGIEKIKKKEFGFGLFGMLMLISPGFLAIFYYQRNLFIELDFFKLIMLSIAFVSPIFILNSLLFATLEQTKNEYSEDSLFISMVTSSFCSGLVILLVMIIGYFMKLKLLRFSIWVLIIEAIFSILLIISIKGERVKRNSKK